MINMEDNEINKIYARKVKIRNILGILSIVPVIIVLASLYVVVVEKYIPINVLVTAAIFFELIIAVLSRINWRCPHCGAFLGMSFFSPNYCKNCGIKLRQLK